MRRRAWRVVLTAHAMDRWRQRMGSGSARHASARIGEHALSRGLVQYRGLWVVPIARPVVALVEITGEGTLRVITVMPSRRAWSHYESRIRMGGSAEKWSPQSTSMAAGPLTGKR